MNHPEHAHQTEGQEPQAAAPTAGEPAKAEKAPKKTAEQKAQEKADREAAKKADKEAKDAVKAKEKAEKEAAKPVKDTKNGVTRPMTGVTKLVWDTADQLSSAKKEAIDRAAVVAALEGKVEVGTVHTQYGRWRKYYGLSETKEARQTRLKAVRDQREADKLKKQAEKAQEKATKEAAEAAAKQEAEQAGAQ